MDSPNLTVESEKTKERVKEKFDHVLDIVDFWLVNQ